MGKKNMKIYAVSIVGILCLVILALFLPQIVFGIQDRYRMSNTEVEKRSGIDVSSINTDYELNMNARMSNFSQIDLESLVVTAIDYDGKENEEISDLLGKVFANEWVERLNDITYYLFQRELKPTFIDLKDYKKYIVYGKDYQDGVALLMWYLDFYLEEPAARVRVLVDSETESIYYIKITADKEQYEKQKGNVATDGIADSGELYSLFAESVTKYMGYYIDYYESDTDKAKYSGKNGDYWYTDMKLDDENCIFKCAFPYGATTLEFQFSATGGEGSRPNIEMGISVIGDLIPEMMQN